MEKKIIEEIIENHLKADASISLFFIGLDTCFYISILLILGCGFKNLFSPKQLLSQVLLLDIALRIFALYYNKFDYDVFNEGVLTCLATLQFFLLNNIFKKLFKDEYYDGRESIEIKSPFLFAIGFFVLNFACPISKIVCILQNALSICAIFAYAYYIQSRITLYVNNLERKRNEVSCRNMSLNLTYLIALYFIIFQVLKICSAFVENKLYYSYMMMATDVFKEGGKFLVYGLMIILINSFNKFNKVEDSADISGEKDAIY